MIEPFYPSAMDDVVIREEDDRDIGFFADLSDDLKHGIRCRASGKRPLIGFLDRRTICNRVRERYPQFKDICSPGESVPGRSGYR